MKVTLKLIITDTNSESKNRIEVNLAQELNDNEVNKFGLDRLSVNLFTTEYVINDNIPNIRAHINLE